MAGLALAEPAPAPVHCEAPRAWMGLKLARPDADDAAANPGLPAGMGFLVSSAEADGPAKAAGFREGDIVWKLSGQMLVNQSQLSALLRLAKPGEEVAISGFRAGKPLEINLKLGTAPPFERCESKRLVRVSGKTASFASGGESAVVRREGPSYRVTITATGGEPVFQGSLGPEGSMESVPENWRRRVRVLCRTLDKAMDGSLADGRQPRPRVVPAPPEQP